VKVLLDTHTFIWWDADPARLSSRASTVPRDQASTVLLSVVSIWEILIKSQLGKMSPRLPLAQIVAQQQANGVVLLPVTLDHVLEVERLPPAHKDPFDRLLIAQARIENAVMLSVDQIFSQYPVRVEW